MWARAAICLAVGTTAALLWYLFFRRYNRRQGEQVVGWIKSALAGTEEVVAIHWLGPALFRGDASAGPWPVPSTRAGGEPDATPHAAALAATMVASRTSFDYLASRPRRPTGLQSGSWPPPMVGPQPTASGSGAKRLDVPAGDAAHPDLTPELAAGSRRYDECSAKLPPVRDAESRLPPHFTAFFRRGSADLALARGLRREERLRKTQGTGGRSVGFTNVVSSFEFRVSR